MSLDWGITESFTEAVNLSTVTSLESSMAQIDHPVHSLCPVPDGTTLLVGGGGGRGSSGVPNTMKVCTVDGGKLNLADTIPFDDAVTGIAYFSGKQSYVAVGVGPHVRLLDAKYKELARFDTGMEHRFFRSLAFSRDGHQLLVVDGDDVLRLLSVPHLKQTECSKEKYTRAQFIVVGDAEYIVTVSSVGVCLFKPAKGLALFAKSQRLSLIPRCLVVDGSFIFVAGMEKGPKIMKLEVKDRRIVVVKSAKPTVDGAILAIAPNAKFISAVTSGGDVALFTKSLSVARRLKRAHGMPATSTCTVGDFVVSGGLDNAILLTPNKGSSHVMLYVALLVLVIAIAISMFLKH